MTFKQIISYVCICAAVVASIGSASIDAAAQGALAPDDNPALGKWRWTFDGGGSIVMTLDELSISADKFDGEGRLVPGESLVAHVHYERLDAAIKMTFDQDDRSGSFTFTPEDSTHMLLDFFGLAVFRIERVE